MRILAISGSLRAASINSALLRAAARLAPSDVSVTVFHDVGELPLFNPDNDADPPANVVRFRSQVASADALMIASPEYAHGVTGTIKNALDWLVSFEPFAHKPVAILNASPRASHADAALREVLRTMAAVIVERASITIPLLGANLDEEDMVTTPSVATSIRESLFALHDAIERHETEPSDPSRH
jgi:chromate reductase, NAD(P)H dehydrogenase (quinone)